jgi:uncharacterized protein
MATPETPRPVTLVTGASGGIGEALAIAFAAAGEDLVLVARNEEALASVAQRITASTGRLALALPIDLEARDAALALKAAVEAEGLVVRHLVNNAGYGLAGDVRDLPRLGQLGIVDLNCRALLDLTLVFLPDILAARGGILNVASVAAFTSGPGLAVYYASKAFVLSFTRALRFELRGLQVRVSALCPGPTPTRFGARAGFRDTRALALARPLGAEAVARIGVSGYLAGREIIVPGLTNKLLVAVATLLPEALVLPILSRIQRGRRSRDLAAPLP